MQYVKDFMFGQILDEFAISGNREEAIERMRMLSTMHNQQVIGVVYEAKDSHHKPGSKSITSLDVEAAFAKQEDGGKGRLEYWEKVGLAYSGPEQELPPDFIYMGGGMVVNCSDEVTLAITEDPIKPCVHFGADNVSDLVTLSFESKENLDQLIEALQAISSGMEPTCSPLMDE